MAKRDQPTSKQERIASHLQDSHVMRSTNVEKDKYMAGSTGNKQNLQKRRNQKKTTKGKKG